MSHPTGTKAEQLYMSRERYVADWKGLFAEKYRPFLREGMTILDVGSGRKPAIPTGKRPENCRYIGLDISAVELALAPYGSYDELHVRDLKDIEPALIGQIDLVISWQVFEHIEPLADAIDNVHAYLKPGGHLVALLSGRNALFSVINRRIPEKLGVLAMKHLLNRPPDTVFRAHYDACTHSELTDLLRQWDRAKVYAHFRGADYFKFSGLLTRLYLVYEDWASGGPRRDLGTHYTIVATCHSASISPSHVTERGGTQV